MPQGSRGRDFSSAAWPPVLPAIYLTKKNIRKQGALVGHEKVGPPRPLAESSQRNPSPALGLLALGPHSLPWSTQPRPQESADTQTRHPYVSQRGGGWSAPPSWTQEGLPSGDLDIPQEHYDQLHRKINHTWDLVVMQAREQLRAAKQRRKGDRLVIACQEQTYWLVNRPPVSPLVGGERGVWFLVQQWGLAGSLCASLRCSLWTYILSLW